MRLQLDGGHKTRRQILCLGAHSDDIEIGCGGTILHWLRCGQLLEFHWVVLSGDARRAREARQSADLFLKGALSQHIHVKRFRDGFFPFQGAEIKEYFNKLQHVLAPDLILTHRRDDSHQDHVMVSKLTWNTWRNHMILEYEIPKYDGDLGSANVYVPFDLDVADLKTDILLRCFGSQTRRQWFAADTFKGLMRLRGIETGAPERYAEAFQCRKLLIAS